MKRQHLKTVWLAAFLILALSASVLADDVSIVRKASPLDQPPDQSLDSPKGTYTGTLRMYVVKPTYHWNGATGIPYENGFMKFSEVTTLNIPDGGSYYHEVTTSVTGMYDTNAAVIGVLFDPTPHQEDAYPPNHYYFWAYYGDGTAIANCGEANAQEVPAGYTHKVFIEEGSATW
ncbi:MAG: hypothetical protein ABIE70_04010 [bacterium]